MIGTEELALEALNGNLPYFREGTDRKAYEVNGVVYKVDMVIGANRLEVFNMLRLRNISTPDFIRIPRFTPYRFGDSIVVAMEFVEGEQVFECYDVINGVPCTCANDGIHVVPDHVKEWFNNHDIFDCGAGNIVYSDGVYTLIDAGE